MQGDPPTTVASRTSPTNIGLALLSGLAAYDLGYLPAAAFLDRTSRMLQTMLHLERYRGHFFNWYNTRTLQPAEPRYVSSVDSGNLWGALTVLSAGLEELRNRPLIPPRLLEGLQDTVEVIADLHRQAASVGMERPARRLHCRTARGVLRRALRGSAANLRAAAPHSPAGGGSGGAGFGRSTGLETMDARARATKRPGPSTLVAIGVLDAVCPPKNGFRRSRPRRPWPPRANAQGKAVATDP